MSQNIITYMGAPDPPNTGSVKGGTLKNPSNSGQQPKGSDPSTTKVTEENIPRFLVVKRIDEIDFNKVSPFVIQKSMYGLIGETKNIKKIKDGLLVETKSDAQTKRLMKVTRFADHAVTVLPHTTLNTSRGVIFCKDLLNCKEDEIKEELKELGIVKVERIKIKKDEQLIDTPNHILTFSNPTLPKTIKVAMYNLEVRPYIPAPIRCFRCQKLGHITVNCTNEPLCPCGKPLHEGQPCENDPTCVNCNGNHSARYRGCPKYKTEQAIQRLRVTEKLTYFEAKKRVIINTPKPNISYAQATTSHTKNEEDIIQKIIPCLENVMKKCISEFLGSKPLQASTPISYQLSRLQDNLTPRSRTGSEASTIPKRKANSPVEETDISDGSQVSTESHQNMSRRGGRTKVKKRFQKSYQIFKKSGQRT